MRRLWIATVVLATAGLLAACGADDSGTAAAGGTGKLTLQTSESDLGTILVDSDGRTVYMFTPDSPGTSVCDAQCLKFWPPVKGNIKAGDGVDADLIGTTKATDGTVIATYDDWPLYYYAQDSVGDTSGQGVDGEWYVLDPGGEPVRKAEKSEAPSGGMGGGYGIY
jgi:predicted lipoprotein with Yx(FWY)xxD motif